MDTVAVFIDGSNFYNKLKELGVRHTPNFNYRGLAEWLAHGRDVVYCGYYVGVVRAKPGEPRNWQLAEGMAEYEQNYRERVVKNLARKAKELGYQLLAPPAALPSRPMALPRHPS